MDAVWDIFQQVKIKDVEGKVDYNHKKID